MAQVGLRPFFDLTDESGIVRPRHERSPPSSPGPFESPGPNAAAPPAAPGHCPSGALALPPPHLGGGSQNHLVHFGPPLGLPNSPIQPIQPIQMVLGPSHRAWRGGVFRRLLRQPPSPVALQRCERPPRLTNFQLNVPNTGQEQPPRRFFGTLRIFEADGNLPMQLFGPSPREVAGPPTPSGKDCTLRLGTGTYAPPRKWRIQPGRGAAGLPIPPSPPPRVAGTDRALETQRGIPEPPHGPPWAGGPRGRNVRVQGAPAEDPRHEIQIGASSPRVRGPRFDPILHASPSAFGPERC